MNPHSVHACNPMQNSAQQKTAELIDYTWIEQN